MNYIDSLENLVELLQNSEDVIFVPGMRGAKSVLDWLEFSDNLKHVGCFATLESDYKLDSVNVLFEKNLPLLKLDCLYHFRENGIFIVATNPIFHNEIYSVMTEHGFKNIFFLSVNVYNEIVEELKKIMTPDYVMQRFMFYVTEKLNKLEISIEEQNEICAVNTATFEKYRNFFQGRKIVIVGSGPTVNYYNPITDAIHIGINYSWRNENIPFEFLFTNDMVANDKKVDIKMEQGFDRIKERVFIGIRPQYLADSTYYDYPVDISLRKNNVSRFYLESIIAGSNRQIQIYRDICRHPVAHFTTVFNAIHFALFTYPAELYLVGCDVSQTGHFYDGNKKTGFYDLKRIKFGYARMKAFAQHHYPETKIISINPVGLKGLFTDIYTDEYKKFLEKG